MNLITPINQLGYGIAGLNILKSLSSLVRVSLFPIGSPQAASQEDALIIRNCLENAQMPDFKAPCIRIWHQHDMSQFVGSKSRIGFPFFELNKFSEIEKHHLNNLDKLFVTSQWAKDICKSELDIEDIHVIPLGVDTSVFKPCEIEDNGKTIFFNCGKWEVRKGHDIIPEVFLKAFDENDDVELWMMNSNPFLNEEETLAWESMYRNNKLGNKIKLIPRVNTQQEVYNIMSKVDCGLFPSRAEGWNLELLELLSCGKHVIATNYSAHTEFCTNKNSHLVEISSLEIAKDNKWFNGKVGEWASISFKEKNELVNLLRHVHETKKSGNLKTNVEGIQTANKFTWSNSSNEILTHV